MDSGNPTLSAALMHSEGAADVLQAASVKNAKNTAKTHGARSFRLGRRRAVGIEWLMGITSSGGLTSGPGTGCL